MKVGVGGAEAALKVGGKVLFLERVTAGCEMLPCSLSQESGGSGAELTSPPAAATVIANIPPCQNMLLMFT